MTLELATVVGHIGVARSLIMERIMLEVEWCSVLAHMRSEGQKTSVVGMHVS
jgi:hypothetical protein